MQLVKLPMRVFLFIVSATIWAGIWLTGFDTAHWLLYIPAVFLLFAAITGICPGIMMSNRLFGGKQGST